MVVLITGFQPFGGEKINPAYEAVKALPDVIGGASIVKLEVPVVYRECGACIKEAVETYKPDVVINVGQAGGRSCVTIERVAINLEECTMADNAADKASGRPVEENGENAYFATIPIKAIVKHVKEHNLPCQISYTAGTYVCNCLMYETLYLASTEYKNMRAGFIHVPYLTSQVADKPGCASMSLEDITKSLEYAIEACIMNDTDIIEEAGMSH